MRKVGVFVCHCGANIASMVDVERVVAESKELPEVAYATDYLFTCSAPGQDQIKQAIQEHHLDGVVVAACSPRMHEPTFRRAVASVGMNPYLVEMANIREHDSWVADDKEEATRKAVDLVRMKVKKVAKLEPLTEIRLPVTSKALVIGGGVAGIQAALDIADGGIDVILVEREPSIGGHMAQYDKTFPTLDCASCILTPRMVEAATHPRITVHTYSELEEVTGFVGNYKVKIRKRARSVDLEKCTGCGDCLEKCPVKVSSEFEADLATRGAIYRPFPQAVPAAPALDREHCTYFLKDGKCGICKKICPTDAIDYDDADEVITDHVGAIVAATGFHFYDATKYTEYGYGKYPDVISWLQFERLTNSSGPTGGKLRRPSDGKAPETIVFIHCVGSRDPSKGFPYCSRICCMATAKHAVIARSKVPDAKIYSFYIDIRAAGKGYEEFVRRAIEQEDIQFIKGRPARVLQKNGKLIVRSENAFTGRPMEVEADLVVLTNGARAQEDAPKLAQILGIGYDQYGFFNELHPKLRPVETNKAGIFLAGMCQGPKDIPESVAQASASAAKTLALLSNPEITREPQVAEVNPARCTGCMDCHAVCFYDAIDEDEYMRRKVAKVNPGMCQGCGACVAHCPDGALEIKLFNDEQIHAEITGLFAAPRAGSGASATLSIATGAGDPPGEASHE
jgi:heterodisulfide reductase subunit A